MTLLRVRLREHHIHRRHAGVRDEPLPPVQHVLVTLTDRGGAHRRTVRARPRFRQRIGRQPLTRGELRQEPLLLLPAARQLDPQRPELLHRHDQPARRTHLRQLLDHHQRQQRARADPAELLVEEHAEQVVLAERLHHIPRELRRSCRSPPHAAPPARAQSPAPTRESRAARRKVDPERSFAGEV